MIASASRNLLSMTTILPRSICWTSPESSSPTLPENSSRMRERSPSRTAVQAAELLERHLLLEHVAGLEVGVFVARFFERDLRAGVFDRFDHRLQHDDANRSFQLVDADLGPHVGPVALHERRVQTVLQEVDELGALELLGVRQLANCGNDVSGICHHTSLSLARRASFTSENRYSCSAPPSGCSTTLSGVGTATMRARTRPRPASLTVTSRPTNCSQC